MSRSTFALSLAVGLGLSSAALAQVTEVDIGINPTYTQTGPSTVTSTGGFFSARAFLTSASDFDGGTLSLPGSGPPQPLTPSSGPILVYSATDADLAALNAAFPPGAYTFSLTNSMTSASETDTVDYSVAADSNVPQFTAPTFAALQGAKAGQSIAVDLVSALQESPNANSAFEFLTLSDTSTGSTTSFSVSSVSPSTTSFVIPGSALAAGQDYLLDINFDDRITGTDANGVPTTVFFDTHTDVSFSTAAVPEPAAWTLLLSGFGAAGVALRRRKASLRAV
jgi:PEP-CTERM motif